MFIILNQIFFKTFGPKDNFAAGWIGSGKASFSVGSRDEDPVLAKNRIRGSYPKPMEIFKSIELIFKIFLKPFFCFNIFGVRRLL